MNRTFSVPQACGPAAEAPLLVNPLTFSPRYDLNRVDGSFSRAGHPLRREHLKGRILASPGVQGGVAGGWAFLAMQGRDVGPIGFIFGEINPVMVQGAVTAGIPIVAGIDPSFFEHAHSGAFVRIDPTARTVELLDPR